METCTELCFLEENPGYNVFDTPMGDDDNDSLVTTSKFGVRSSSYLFLLTVCYIGV